MPFYSPLRYPGGKRRLSSFVMRLLETNEMRDIQYVEPYAGGASLALALLFEEYAATIHINDLARPVYAFWDSVLNDTEALCRRIERTPVTMKEWHKQHAVYENREEADLSDLGFATFFLNRTNRSGIIGGGVIGGKQQTGEWGVDARFTKDELIARIRRIGRYRNRIRLYQQDALAFTKDVITGLRGDVFCFFDPPYIDKGGTLYLNNYDISDHRKLADRVVRLKRQKWVVTYDYEPAVEHDLYPTQRRLAFELSYSAQERRGGKEAMFLSDQLTLPEEWGKDVVIPMSHHRSEYPVFGTMEVMKEPDGPEVEEGKDAAKRFRDLAKKIVSVPKDRIPKDAPSKNTKKPAT